MQSMAENLMNHCSKSRALSFSLTDEDICGRMLFVFYLLIIRVVKAGHVLFEAAVFPPPLI
jgi:hypothetical protein